MDEKTVTMMEGVAREWRVRVMDSAGNVLNPEGFSFYGAAADGVQVPRRMQVHVEGDVAVLRLPGLWMSGRCWRYQVLCQDVLTGVEWVLCQGDVVLERRVACNGPALHEDAVLVDAVMDSEMEQVDVYLGDSTAASAEAARRAEASRDAAEAEAARAWDAAAKAEDLKRVALDAAAGAALSAEGAADAKRGAEAAAVDAAADAQLAEAAAAGAEASREAAEADAKLAGARAAEADASAKVAADAVSDALAARDEAAAARGGAEDALRAAGALAGESKDSADAAEAARDEAAAAQVKAEAAQAEAEAAQSGAEEQAEIATKAAADAQSPASIAAQAARPATMVLLKDELLRILGSSDAFIVDTDGQRIILHADRLEGEQLAKVEDMLGRFVPQFIEVAWKWMPPEGTTLAQYKEVWEKEEVVLSEYAPLPAQANMQYYAFKKAKTKTLPPWVFSNATVCQNTFKDSMIETLPDVFMFPDLIISSEIGAHGLFAYAKQLEEIPESWTFEKLKYGSEFASYTPNLKRAHGLNLISLKEANNFMHQAQVDKITALRVFQTIPENTANSAPLVIGIHVDHKADDEVLAAIAEAEAKGWPITVQWNGTPTAQASVTYGLRKPPIYARVNEYERPDGTVERHLEWGHYVTDPTGYEEFRSVEAAREYFGLPEEI